MFVSFFTHCRIGFAEPLLKHLELVNETVLINAQRTLEEAGQKLEQTRLTTVPCQLSEANQVDHQGGGQHRIAPLPNELERHWSSEESGKMNVVPGGLPIAEAFNELDRNVGLRLVAEDLTEEAILAFKLGPLVGRIIEDSAVHITEDVVAHPAHHLAVPSGEHGGQNALQKGFTRLPVATGMSAAAESGQIINGSRSRTQ